MRAPLALIQHDLAIGVAAARQALSSAVDALTVLLVVPLLCLVTRAALADMPPDRLRLMVFALGILAGYTLAQFLRARIDYHRSEGILAAQALVASNCVLYALAFIFCWVLIVGGALTLLGLIAPAALLLGVFTGAVLFALGQLIKRPQATRDTRLSPDGSSPGERIALTPPRLLAGGLVVGLVAALIPADSKTAGSLIVLAAAVASLTLARVSAGDVRYITMVGHETAPLVLRYAARPLAFFAGFTLGLLASLHPAFIAIGLVALIAVPVAVALRVLAYRVYPPHLADWFASITFAATVAVGVSLPPAAPAVLFLALFWLSRRSASQTWLIE